MHKGRLEEWPFFDSMMLSALQQVLLTSVIHTVIFMILVMSRT